MAYSEAKLKSSGEKASPCLKSFLIGNVRQMLAYPDSIIGFRHIFISLTSFIDIPNSMRME